MQECQTPNVPSFYALQKMQESLTKQVGIIPKLHTSAMGNHFYMNHPAKLFGLDWGNPLVQDSIHVYPEMKGPICEMWQASKWLEEVNLDELSPMWADWKDPSNAHWHYYIKELAQVDGGSYVVPLRWVTIAGIPHADVLNATYDSEHKEFVIKSGSANQIPCSTFHKNVLNIKSKFGDLHFSGNMAEYSLKYNMPNPLCEIAKGHAMFRIRSMPWSDDVSGNVSKQYNAHTNLYITNSSLPHRALSQEYFVRFCSTSQHASSSKQFAALKDDFNADVWHEAYDCELEDTILFQIIPHALPADNPQQSETSSHIGVNGSYNCRRDLTGGTDIEKETSTGYQALYCVGEPRTPQSTLQVIHWQLWTACTGNKEVLQSSYTRTGIKDKIALFWIDQLIAKAKDMRKQRLTDIGILEVRQKYAELEKVPRQVIKNRIGFDIQVELWEWLIQQPNDSFRTLKDNDSARHDLRPGDHYNMLLMTHGIDPHQDTPVEILHTYLLGNNKYVWHDTSKSWDKKKDELFAIRLQSLLIDGLTTPAPRAWYLVQYKNGLVGKHFKILQQLAVFHLNDLCPEPIFRLWKATGELGALIWQPKIKDMNTFLIDLQVLIDNLLDMWAEVDPRRIITKLKLHVLPHLIDDFRCFGPAILYSTEIFECFNAVFRFCSVLSNHIAPSHNIAITMLDMERFKHMVSGGWWKINEKEYIQAGKHIHTFLINNLELQRRLGWAAVEKKPAAPLAFMARINSRYSSFWNEYQGTLFHNCKYFISISQDLCCDNSWVFWKYQEVVCARVTNSQTLKQPNKDDVFVVIQCYEVSSQKDLRLNMPILSSVAGPVLAQAKDILFIFNAQHDCVTAGCKISESAEHEHQERLETTISRKSVIHSPLDRYILNMHSLHNAHLVREVLPRSLTAPVQYHANRSNVHQQIAASLRITGPTKRAETQAKAHETRRKNQAAKEQRSHTVSESARATVT
ncbi:hypothetical protein BDQ12DRAFT_763286 [Crucibulum laeve]|uniref:Uncharacterized protein n=1 Tax=Crucibulum laeve TaxID=68775 RepID=A0A5C3LQA4_9AGAR|nr:hypothetical protein BDQ12DRAFT_763286 [Crucibulum laeve]